MVQVEKEWEFGLGDSSSDEAGPNCNRSYKGHESQGKGSQGFPIRTIRDYQGLLGLIGACWVALAPQYRPQIVWRFVMGTPTKMTLLLIQD